MIDLKSLPIDVTNGVGVVTVEIESGKARYQLDYVLVLPRHIAGLHPESLETTQRCYAILKALRPDHVGSDNQILIRYYTLDEYYRAKVEVIADLSEVRRALDEYHARAEDTLP